MFAVSTNGSGLADSVGRSDSDWPVCALSPPRSFWDARAGWRLVSELDASRRQLVRGAGGDAPRVSSDLDGVSKMNQGRRL